MELRESPGHPSNVRTQEEAHSTLEMEFCGGHPGGPDDSEVISNPQPDQACRLSDKPVRAVTFEDFRRDGGMVPTMAPPGAPFKLAPDIYDRNTDLEEYLVYFKQLAMFNMWN